MNKIKLYHQFINENVSNKNFVIEDNKFKLFSNNILVSESNFNIEEPDDFFNEKYISLYDIKTNEKYQGQGFAKYLMNKIFDYVKNNLNIKIITLIVDKDNYKATDLYFKIGFKIFIEYKDSFSLIKKL